MASSPHPSDSSSSDPATLLRTAGLRRTPARVAVIDSLRTEARPISVQDLLSRLPEKTDAVTVYRTLKTLVDNGLARRVHAEERGGLYELVATGSPQVHQHPHFVCDSCGTVECVPDVSLATKLPMSEKLSRGYEVTMQELTLHGVCPKCHD